ncbi:hypothetical protein BDR04DRAFT_1158294 [Suillus decipiens]|nr:hypothetical protein BDR04DRAFT_1158294 [Suillus decipiens]
MAKISAQWKAMTTEEQELATDGLIRKTLESMDHELEALHAHTGMEILLFTVHSDVNHYNQPHVFQTGHAASFFDACFGTSAN